MPVVFTGTADSKGAVPKDTSVATEEIGGVSYQLLKLADATPGSTGQAGTKASPLRTLETVPQTGAVTSGILPSTGAQTLLAANVDRRGGMVYNDAAGILVLAFGHAATTGAYVVQVPAGGYFELPAPAYPGLISGLWLSTSTGGAAMVTEVA